MKQNTSIIKTYLLQHLPAIKLIYLFGSQASDTARSHSDVDIAILTSDKLDPLLRWEMQNALANQLNKEVDLIDLTEASTVLQHQVVMKGKCIYDAHQHAKYFANKVMSLYQHLNEERAAILAQFKNEDRHG